MYYINTYIDKIKYFQKFILIHKEFKHKELVKIFFIKNGFMPLAI